MTAPTLLDPPPTARPAPPVLFVGLTPAQIDEYEVRVEETVRAALRRVMRKVTPALGDTTTAAGDAAAVSPDDLAPITGLWRAEVDEAITPIVAEVYRDSGDHLHAQMVDAVGDIPHVSSLAAETYLTQAANTFDEVGAELWETARAQLVEGMRAGEDIPTLARRLRVTTPEVTSRTAVLVARTQVNDAANAGSYATAQASGLDLVKGWEATPDFRTRESHLLAGSRYSGPQMIPMVEKFVVGGWPCDRPHDPALPASERYNCRCTVVYRMRGEPPDPGQAYLEQLEALHTRRVTDLERRHTARLDDIEAKHMAHLAKIDESVEGAGAAVRSATLAHEARVAELVRAHQARLRLLAAEHQRRLAVARGQEPPALPATAVPTGPDFEAALKDVAALRAAPVSTTGWHPRPRIMTLLGLPDDVGAEHAERLRLAVQNWSGGGPSGFATVNQTLESGHLAAASSGIRDVVAGLDELMGYSPLGQDIVVFRGIRDFSRMLPQGSTARPGRMAGVEWISRGFSSTSSRVGVAERFATRVVSGAPADVGVDPPQPAVLRVFAPRGARGFALDSPDPDATDDQELLLARGLRHRVVADHGLDGEGIWRLDVEIVPEGIPRRLPSVPPPVRPSPGLPGAPTPVPVRPSLAAAQTITDVRKAFLTEWQQIVKANPGAVRGSAKFLPVGDVQTAREHAEGLLRAVEQFPLVRLDIDHGVLSSPNNWAETSAWVVSFADHFAVARDDYLVGLRMAATADPDGTSWHPPSIASPQAVALHEFGHALHWALSQGPMGGFSEELYERVQDAARRITRTLAVQRDVEADDLVKAELGGYANEGGRPELVAQAFTDVMVNGDAASELGRRVFAMLVAEYRQIHQVAPGRLRLPPYLPPRPIAGPPPLSAAEARRQLAAVDRARPYGDILVDYDELRASGASAAAMAARLQSRMDLAGLRDQRLVRLIAAVRAGDQAVVDRELAAVRRSRRLTLVGQTGDFDLYDPARHEALETGLAVGSPVRLVRPGVSFQRGPDDVVVLSRPAVLSTSERTVADLLPEWVTTARETIALKTPPDTVYRAVVGDGLELLDLLELRSLATEFEIPGAAKLTKSRARAELRKLGVVAPDVRRKQALGEAIGEAIDYLETHPGEAGVQGLVKLMTDYSGGAPVVTRAKMAPVATGPRLVDRLERLAESRGITLPTKAQVKVIKARRLKAAKEAAAAARVEKARQAAIKRQVKEIEAGDFKALTAQDVPDLFTAPDGTTWAVHRFTSETEAREHVLAVALRDLVDPAKPRPPVVPVAGRGAPGVSGWQVAYRGATVLPDLPNLDAWLSADLPRLVAVTPARLRALVAKVGLSPDVAKRLVERRADAVAAAQAMAHKFRTRLAPGLDDLAALARERRPARFIDGTYGSLGLRAKVTKFVVNPGAAPGGWTPHAKPAEFNGVIYLGGRRVGTFERDYAFDEDGVLYAHHALLEIDPDVRGSGFAEEFNANLYDWYRRSGIKQVRLYANIDVGGYAWARAGYDFANQQSADKILDRLRTLVGELTSRQSVYVVSRIFGAPLTPEEVTAQVRAARALIRRAEAHRRFDDPLHPRAQEFSQVGRHAGQGKDDRWIGKAAMLRTRWNAVLYL